MSTVEVEKRETDRSAPGDMMYRDKIETPVKGPGLFLFLVQHIFFVVLILYEIYQIASYQTVTPGSISIAEAAYITSRWTQVVCASCAWIAWTLFCATFIIANRITRLHEAYLSSFPVEPQAVPDPGAPRVGNHSVAGINRRGVYAGRDFAVHGDGLVVSRLGNDVATWRTETEFQAWADRQDAVPTAAQ